MAAPLRRRLRHRIPVRVRHYWKLLATCVVFLVAVPVVFGTARVHPYVTSDSDDQTDKVINNIEGTRDLFDTAVAHSVTLTFRDADYQRMLDTYFDRGEKDYVEADLVIDGTPVNSVGIRLKGNSTLSQLTRDGVSRRGGPGGGAAGNAATAGGGRPNGFPADAGAGQGRQGAGGQMPEGAMPDAGAMPEGGAAPGAAAPGGTAQGGGVGVGLEAEKPENLPWLVRFDEFVEGQRFQGHREIALRISSMGGGSTVLNEAVSLDLLAAAGEVAQRYAYVSFTVNDRPAAVRLVVEHPDDSFADRLPSTGVLYKALSTSQFTDQGDDPIAYEDDFRQITMKGSQDLQPVIDLLKWVNASGDTEFDQHLADYVDVPAFARYVALQNLLLNFDDMSGPGRNYYLWYNLDTKKFQVVGWDYNLTFSGDASQGPHEQGGLGGGFGGARQNGAQRPAGTQPNTTANGNTANGKRNNAAGGDRAGLPGGGGGFGGGSGNRLKERFLASKAFTTVYEDAYREMYQKVFASGQALTSVDKISAVLATVGGYDATTVTQSADQIRTLIQQRTQSLATNEVIRRS